MLRHLATLCAGILLSFPVFGDVLHVDRDNVSETEDGLSWATAFTTIQPAVDAASGEGAGEVWIAEGVYNEVRSSIYVHPEDTGAVPIDTGSLVLKEGVRLYGGFAGSELGRGERDPEGHPSVIDGSASLGGAGALHVIIGADQCELNGVTVTGGRAPYQETSSFRGKSGAGLFIHGASMTLTNCVFEDNRASWRGGALYAKLSSVEVTDTIFDNNHATSPISRGGAVEVSDSTITLDGCRFSGNSAQGAGGGIYTRRSSSTVTITNCTFTENVADIGGAVSARVLAAEGCFFRGNVALKGGGAIFAENGDAHNCVFSLNEAGTEDPVFGGGAIFSSGGSFLVTNSVFVGNRSYEGATAVRNVMGFLTIVNCTLANNSVDGEAVILNTDGAMDIVNCILWNPDIPEVVSVLTLEKGIQDPEQWKDVIYGAQWTSVSFSDVLGGYDGEGNFDEDPLFVDPENGDFRLGSGSSAIDTGTATNAPDTDIRGVVRPQGEGVDMGAYEFVGAGGAIVLEGVEPASGPVGGGNQVDILGAFAALDSVAGAQALYMVTFGDQQAGFPDVPLKVVATSGALYVTAPSQDFLETTSVMVRVVDVQTPTNFAELTNAYTYFVTPEDESHGEGVSEGEGEGEGVGEGEGEGAPPEGEGESVVGGGEGEGKGEGPVISCVAGSAQGPATTRWILPVGDSLVVVFAAGALLSRRRKRPGA